MYKISAIYLMIFGLCVASPVPEISSSSPPQGGFPAAAYLPAILGLENATGNLYLPLKPGDYYDSEQRFAFGPASGGPFQGGGLISSIAAQVYASWEDTANAAIPAIHMNRDETFLNVLHRVRPLRGTGRPDQVLTPLKVGIAYLNMMRNIPQTGAANNATQGGNDDQLLNIVPDMQVRIVTKTSPSLNRELSTLPKDTRERSWLNIYLSLMVYALAEAPSLSVNSRLPPGGIGPKKSVTLHFGDTLFDTKMEGNLTVQSFDDPGLNRALTYDILAKTLLKLVVNAAERDMWDYTEKSEIFGNGQSLANITFGPTARGRSANSVWNGIELAEI
ncbi:MAG: hypothetical protein Q9170_005272 [Blastenia crenularia]